MSSDEKEKYVEWTNDHENILVEWADKAMCYRWLHTKSHARYTFYNAWFTIPVIIMSTITGTANFAQDRLPSSIRQHASSAIGAVNILAGILTTIQQFLKISELNEAHRVSIIAWDKFYRNIKVELAKSPAERTPVIQMLKVSKEEFDRLMETSPTISDKVIKQFRTVLSDKNCKIDNLDASSNLLSYKQKTFLELKKPEICDVLETTKKSVYKNEGCVDYSEQLEQQTQKSMEIQKIDLFIKEFIKERNRQPTKSEILDEMTDINNVELTVVTHKD